jgi:hypothetical protein
VSTAQPEIAIAMMAEVMAVSPNERIRICAER